MHFPRAIRILTMALVLAWVHAQVQLLSKSTAFDIFTTSRQRFRGNVTVNCAKDSNCKRGCICDGGTCASPKVYIAETGKCARCSSRSDCSGATSCETTYKAPICTVCEQDALIMAQRECVPVPNVIRTCASGTDCPPDCTCQEESCLNEKKFLSVEARCKNCTSDSDCNDPEGCLVELNACRTCFWFALQDGIRACNKDAVARWCVSTTWLEQEGLSDAAIRNFESAPVLCIPGLPCATPGHLLRECKSGEKSCTLITYQEQCRQRSDCISSTMPVSRLRNTFDWSVYQAIGSSPDSTIHLTSISANPSSGPLSFSFTLARVADALVRNGLGVLCDGIVIVIDCLQIILHETLTKFHAILTLTRK